MTMDEVDVLLQGLEDSSGKVHYEGKLNGNSKHSHEQRSRGAESYSLFLWQM